MFKADSETKIELAEEANFVPDHKDSATRSRTKQSGAPQSVLGKRSRASEETKARFSRQKISNGGGVHHTNGAVSNKSHNG